MMDYLVTYGVMTFDVLLILAFFYVIFVNLPKRRLSGAVKGILFVVVLWFVARFLKFYMTEAVLAQIIQYGFLAVIIMFPNEFRKLLENIGRRRVFSWNTNRLIEPDSRKELAEAVVNMARKKQGAVIVIAREDNLEEEANKGELVGEMVIKKEFVEMIFSESSKLNRGAMIIRDDVIISANARLPLANNQKLREAGAGRRHLAGLGIVAKKDSMAIVVSGDTGYITLVGYVDDGVVLDFAMPLREYDLHDGIDETYIVNRIEDFLRGTVKEEDTNKGRKRKEVKTGGKKGKEKESKKKEKKVKEKKVKKGKKVKNTGSEEEVGVKRGIDKGEGFSAGELSEQRIIKGNLEEEEVGKRSGRRRRR